MTRTDTLNQCRVRQYHECRQTRQTDVWKNFVHKFGSCGNLTFWIVFCLGCFGSCFRLGFFDLVVSHVISGVTCCACFTLAISVLQIVLKWCHKEREKNQDQWWVWLQGLPQLWHLRHQRARWREVMKVKTKQSNNKIPKPKTTTITKKKKNRDNKNIKKTKTTFFGQNVCDFVFGVDVLDMDCWIQCDSIEQPIKRNSVDPGTCLLVGLLPSFHDHFDHDFVVFAERHESS